MDYIIFFFTVNFDHVQIKIVNVSSLDRENSPLRTEAY